MANQDKYKNMTFGFYTSGQDDQTKTLVTEDIFKKATNHYTQVILGSATAWVETIEAERKIKLSPIQVDLPTGYYWGAISKVRVETLPYLGNATGSKERKIPLSSDEEVWERSYFLYSPKDDILVFQENIVGPKASDLAYILFKQCVNGKGSFTFESIWKSSAIEDLLNKKCTFKKVELSVALPRNFHLSKMNIDDPWASQIVDMMSNVGMSKLNLVFFGRASTRKKVTGYISDSIGESIKFMLEKFGTAKGAPLLKKAKLVSSGGKSEEVNLLDEKIKAKVRLACSDGYETELDVFNKMKYAKIEKDADLDIYKLNQ